MMDTQAMEQWRNIQLPVTFDVRTGEIRCRFGFRLFEVLTPGGHPNQLLGPVVAAAINSRDAAMRRDVLESSIAGGF